MVAADRVPAHTLYMVYEHRSQPLLSRRAFARRMGHHLSWAMLLVALSTAIGMLGYRGLASMTWVDAFLNACMLLGGMGPVGELPNDASKVFAGVFALYSGLVFIGVTALLLAPILHRVMHRFHIERGHTAD